MNPDNTIYEYDKVENELAKHIKENKHLHKYFTQNWGDVKASQYCGILNYDNQNFLILPKISKDTDKNLNIFIYMLMYAYDIKIENEQIASCANHQSDILEVLISLFTKNLFSQLQRGIYKKYRTNRENLPVLKGKYLINENLKYNVTKNKIYCEFDEFSENNTLNQFFLYAIKTLMPYARNKKLLKMCELIFNEVEFKHFDINNLHIHFDRLNIRFKDSFEIALLLLQKLIPMFDDGEKSFAFLFDMNALFEKFISNIYKNTFANVKLQNERNFGNLKLIPDIVCDGLIIDAKYKIAISKDDLKRDDKYQMFVYGSNFKISNTMLLYPQHIREMNEDLKLGKDDKIVELKMRSINLGFDGDYDGYIEAIKTRINNIN